MKRVYPVFGAGAVPHWRGGLLLISTRVLSFLQYTRKAKRGNTHLPVVHCTSKKRFS